MAKKIAKKATSKKTTRKKTTRKTKEEIDQGPVVDNAFAEPLPNEVDNIVANQTSLTLQELLRIEQLTSNTTITRQSLLLAEQDLKNKELELQILMNRIQSVKVECKRKDAALSSAKRVAGSYINEIKEKYSISGDLAYDPETGVLDR